MELLFWNLETTFSEVWEKAFATNVKPLHIEPVLTDSQCLVQAVHDDWGCQIWPLLAIKAPTGHGHTGTWASLSISQCLAQRREKQRAVKKSEVQQSLRGCADKQSGTRE